MEGGVVPGVSLVERWHVVGAPEGHCVCEAETPHFLALWLQQYVASVTFEIVPVECVSRPRACPEDGALFAVEYALMAEEMSCDCVGHWHNAVSNTGLLIVATPPRAIPSPSATVRPVLTDAQQLALPPLVRRQPRWWSSQ